MSYCDIGEAADFYRAAVRNARKPHTCDECSGSINPGERYERAFMVHEGSAADFLTCSRCLPMAEWVMRNCGCRMHPDLWRHLIEDVFDGLGFDLPPGVRFKVGRWIVAFRRRGGVAGT